ncbi:MAG TPA: ferrous iron transport protein A [Planctomycetes bacterium]|nr:ferrous iron transport protein A [Planctomycetota bacterium]HIK60779.1 ferrous iron transport protein A [Planctomycetota bacterium]
MTPLTSLPPGGCGRLLSLGGERSFRRRLMELGLLPGTEFRLVRLVHVGGMVEVEVRGCHISLRMSEAEQIEVEAIAP